MTNQELTPDSLPRSLFTDNERNEPVNAAYWKRACKKLLDAWQADKDALAKAEARIAELHKALAMTNCMIKCGDYHSEQSEQIVRKALDGD